MMGTGPIFDGMGMINAIYSYESEIAISFTADRDMVPDPAVYAAALQDAFEELRVADMSAAAPKPKKAAPAKKAKAAKPKKSG
jgi:diacylglycerol O-acyltransferase / wax synthase